MNQLQQEHQNQKLQFHQQHRQQQPQQLPPQQLPPQQLPPQQLPPQQLPPQQLPPQHQYSGPQEWLNRVDSGLHRQEQQFEQPQQQYRQQQFEQPQQHQQQSLQQPQPSQQESNPTKRTSKHLHFEVIQQPPQQLPDRRDSQVQKPSFAERKQSSAGTNRDVSLQSLSLPPASMSNCSPSLLYLTQIDQLIIKQQKEILEVITGMDLPNNYVVFNTMGQAIYFATEKSSAIVRHCCGPTRSFEICLADGNGEDVLHVSRPYKCMCLHQGLSCMKCCKDLVTVSTPSGQLMGQVRQIHRKCDATYEILDPDGNKVLSIDGPNYCHCYCPGDDIPFSVKTPDGQEVGRMSRQWSNLMQEYFTDADNFGITFPVDLNLNVKATIIGACFLIDFMFFEKSGRMF